MENIWLWIIIAAVAIVILFFALKPKKKESMPEDVSAPEAPNPTESSDNAEENSSEKEKPME